MQRLELLPEGRLSGNVVSASASIHLRIRCAFYAAFPILCQLFDEAEACYAIGDSERLLDVPEVRVQCKQGDERLAAAVLLGLSLKARLLAPEDRQSPVKITELWTAIAGAADCARARRLELRLWGAWIASPIPAPFLTPGTHRL